MKKLGLGVMAASVLAAAAFLTSLPSAALGIGGGAAAGTPAGAADFVVPVRGQGMIYWPPMGGGGGPGNWHRPGGPGNWHGPGPGNWHGPGRPGNWHGNNWYNGHYHGPRYHYRYPGYNYYHGGFWYPFPWWTIGGYGLGYGYGWYDNGYYRPRSRVSSHVAWCLNRYRSYDPRSNTYMGYDGRRHICRGPY